MSKKILKFRISPRILYEHFRDCNIFVEISDKSLEISNLCLEMSRDIWRLSNFLRNF